VPRRDLRQFFSDRKASRRRRAAKALARALLLAALHAQRSRGYAYAIIGGVGPAAFYAKVVGAIDIPGSTPGIYGGMLRP
jgi:hypothetical protein